MALLACDIGLNGGLTFADVNGFHCFSMPLREERYGSKTRKTIDGEKIGEWLRQYDCEFAYIEKVNAMPGQGVTSMFRFGEGKGIVYGACMAMRVPIVEIPSMTWKKYYNLGRDKDESRQLAIKLFPNHKESFKRKKDDGVAESALILEYARKEIYGKL